MRQIAPDIVEEREGITALDGFGSRSSKAVGGSRANVHQVLTRTLPADGTSADALIAHHYTWCTYYLVQKHVAFGLLLSTDGKRSRLSKPALRSHKRGKKSSADRS